MRLAQDLGPHHRRHSREMWCRVDVGRQKVDSSYLGRVMICEGVMAVQDGNCKWHKGLEEDVEEEHRSVAHWRETETDYRSRWLPC